MVYIMVLGIHIWLMALGYDELAVVLLSKFHLFGKVMLNKPVVEAVQGEGFVLHYISRHGGNVFPGEICRNMCVSTARVAMALNSLEKKGLITRRVDVSDRRKVLIGITSEGKLLAEKHDRAAMEAVVRVLSLLGEHDAKEYVRITGRLVELLPSMNDS